MLSGCYYNLELIRNQVLNEETNSSVMPQTPMPGSIESLRILNAIFLHLPLGGLGSLGLFLA